MSDTATIRRPILKRFGVNLSGDEENNAVGNGADPIAASRAVSAGQEAAEREVVAALAEVTQAQQAIKTAEEEAAARAAADDQADADAMAVVLRAFKRRGGDPLVPIPEVARVTRLVAAALRSVQGSTTGLTESAFAEVDAAKAKLEAFRSALVERAMAQGRTQNTPAPNEEGGDIRKDGGT